MQIDRYEMVYNQTTRQEEWYAVIGKKRIPMPSAFRDMYDDKHLAIEKVHSDRPEVLDVPDADYYIPLRTARCQTIPMCQTSKSPPSSNCAMR